MCFCGWNQWYHTILHHILSLICQCKSCTVDKHLNVSLLLLVDQSDDYDGEDGDGEDGDEINSDDLEAFSSSLSDLRFSSLDGAVLASCSPPTSTQSSLHKNLSSLSQEPQDASYPETIKETPTIQVEDPLVRVTPHHNPLTDMGVHGAPTPCPAYLDSQSRLTSASPLDVHSDWKTCRWPILPPIMPQRGEHL